MGRTKFHCLDKRENIVTITSTNTRAVTTTDTAPAESSKKPRDPWTSTMVRLIEAALGPDLDKVDIESEYQLFSEPMRADVVIIKKKAGVVLNNAVMRCFENHNIIELKSPRDTLNMKAFDKDMAYIYAYMSEKGYKSKQPPMELGDLTSTIISVRRPRKFMETLCEKRNCKFVETETPGIYRVVGDHIPMLMQLVITSELPKDENDKLVEWLQVFRDNLTKEETVEVYKKIENMDPDDMMNAVGDFIFKVNPDTLEEIFKMFPSAKYKAVIRKAAIESGTVDELIHDANVETAKKMVAKGYKTSDIAEISGLTMSEVKQLQRQLQPA